MSTCRRARSSDASSCWFGDVEVWVRNASTERVAGKRVEVLVADVDHRRLPKRRQRLVRRVRRVHPDPRPAGVGQQPVIDPLRAGDPLHRRGPIPVFLGVFRRRQHLLETLRRHHRGPLPGPRHGGGERVPRLVPQEADVRLDRQHFLHDATGVVDDAVEDAVGEQQHAHPVQLPGRLEVQQRLLDRAAAAPLRRSRTAATDTRPGTAGTRRPAPGRSGATCGSCGRSARCRPAGSGTARRSCWRSTCRW